MSDLVEILRFISIGAILNLFVVFNIFKRRDDHIFSTYFFLFCLLTYLLAYWGPIFNSNIAIHCLLPFSVALPLSFWVFSKSQFDDNFTWNRARTLGLILVMVVHTALFELNGILPDDDRLLHLPPYILSILFVALGLFECIRNIKSDLVWYRVNFRYRLIILSSIVMFVTLFSLMTLQSDDLPFEFEVIQKTIILLLILAFSSYFLNLNSELVNSTTKTKVDVLDKGILIKLKSFMEDDKGYLTEELSISGLSKILDLKEYKLRKVINQQLGFRNFNEYLNKYRIDYAKDQLMNYSKNGLNISEIAYQAGFKSLAPFNKAFRESTGQTPSEYKVDHLKK